MKRSASPRRGPISVIRRFLHNEAAGGVLLMAAAGLALIVANSPVAGAYFDILHRPLGPLSPIHWINDGAMALFFLLVGLEIKRELIDGHLATWADRLLPSAAAAGGMVVPAAFYLVIVGNDAALARGWAIPAATDIAFAIGVMALLGSRVPTSLKLLLTTIAIVDDMGAVAIIALAYTAQLGWVALAAAAVILSLMFGLNRGGVKALSPYLLLAPMLWIAVFLSGIHATVAGVLAAAVIPIHASPGAPDRESSPLHRLETRLHPWVAFAIVPLFGFANAGVSFAGGGIAGPTPVLPLAIAAGLFLGKQAGIFGTIWLCHRLRIAARPAGASWLQLYGLALLCGIGFTMSLFIGGLAFADPKAMDAVRIGVLGGSILSAVAGFAVLRLAPARMPRKPG